MSKSILSCFLVLVLFVCLYCLFVFHNHLCDIGFCVNAMVSFDCSVLPSRANILYVSCAIVISWTLLFILKVILLVNVRTVTCYLHNDLFFLSQTWQRCIVVAHNSRYAHRNHSNSQGS